MAWIVGFISQKGGVGKSTKARALAREASACGIKTKLADLDLEQATSAEWHRRRLSAGLSPVASVEVFSTAKQAIESAGDFDLLILDGPARASK
ncbi:TPA: AAA family ATPase, partial [Salmonella enterica subsp. enterica serovar Putten]|nr:ParA family protein [Escherichia coli]HBJ6712749.1 AAA family ATPase [Salmonella enterica subsp. enterica serovar Putten]